MTRIEPMLAKQDGTSIYAVLAQRARSHSPRFLTSQAVATGLGAAFLLGSFPAWWPLASVLLAVALYSTWGLTDAAERAGRARRLIKPLKGLLAGLATVASLIGLVGAAVAAFTGDAPSPYGACYTAEGRSFACDGAGRPRSPSPP